MNLAPDDLQQGLADAARALLERDAPVSDLVRLGDAVTVRERIWASAVEQGWLALGLAEADGGLGVGLAEEMMVFRELGRFVTPGPFLSSLLSARVAAGSGDAELAGCIVRGERRVGMVVGDLAIDVDSDGLALRLGSDGGELVEVGGLVEVESMDPHTRTSRFTSARRVAGVDDPALLARGRVLAAAELLGIIEAVRDMSAGYAKVRHQFGVPIGSFQAVKHRCSDMAIAALATIGGVGQAALHVEAGHPDADFDAASAYLLAARGAYRSAADNIQNHGGIGFTWEHPAHLYLKRCVVIENLFGALRESMETVLAPGRLEFR